MNLMHGAGQGFAHKLAQLLVRLNRELGMTVPLRQNSSCRLSAGLRIGFACSIGRNVAQGHVNELNDEPYCPLDVALEARR